MSETAAPISQENLVPLVLAVKDGRAIVTSLLVAAHFGKLHKNVLQAIQSLDCSPEFSRLNFQPAEYLDEQGKPRPNYEITRDGFTFLAMGFTGREAAQWKERYIAAFNEMEANLQKIHARAAAAPFLSHQPSHGADLAVAADRTFRSYLRAARSSGMALSAALKIANRKTAERTGMDLLADLEIDPDARPDKKEVAAEELPPDPLHEAILQWAAQANPGDAFRMCDILHAVSGVSPKSKAFQSQAPIAGRLLRRLGWRTFDRRNGAPSAHRYWQK